MKIEQAVALSHKMLPGDFKLLELKCPRIAGAAKPGQFVHLRIPNLSNAVLRRPFSIYNAGRGRISILYKVIGRGTEALAGIQPGAALSLIGPLGNGFPAFRKDRFPVLVAGGYGVAPLYFMARKSAGKGILFVGGATKSAVLCRAEFARLGWRIVVTTDDGSLGKKGLVTAALEEWLRKGGRKVVPEFYACGPDGMLKAVGAIAMRNRWTAWLSLDKHMGCGVGACLACVQKIRTEDGTPVWMRICREGPVFEAGRIAWGQKSENEE